MFSSLLLATAFGAGVSSMVVAKKDSINNNLRSVALFSAEQTIENLRAVGRQELLDRMVKDESGEAAVWSFDPVEDGMVDEYLTIRPNFEKNHVSGTMVKADSGHLNMLQVCNVLTPDLDGEPDPRWLNVYVEISWVHSGRVYRDSLFTIIE